MNHYIGLAIDSDIPAIKAIADANKQTLGFIRLSATRESQAKEELIVAKIEDLVIGFARIHRRRDGWMTLYEICVAAKYRGGGWGEGLLKFVISQGMPVRCKVPENGPVSFYERFGFHVAGKEQGKKRELFVCEYRSNPM